MSGSNSSARDAEPLGLTVHSLAAPDLADDRVAQAQRTRMGRVKMLLVLLLCASPVIASYFTYYVIRPEGRTNYGELILPTRSLPATLPLRTLDGQAVDPAALRKQWLLLVVSPSACDAACEKQLYMQRQLREMLGREAPRLDKLWLVTDDGPLAPALLQALQAEPAVTVLRSDPAQLAAWLQPAPGQALETHLYVVDPMGEWMMRFPPTPEPARVKRDLDRLLRASGSWDQPGR
jgi:hypothetical protein